MRFWPFFLSRPHGLDEWIERCLLPVLGNHGVVGTSALWTMQDQTAEILKTTAAGTVADYFGRANGTVSGKTYYNQLTVSGTLNPDVTGTYTVGGMQNGKPYWRRGSDNWFVWWRSAGLTDWRLTSELGNGVTTYRWSTYGNPDTSLLNASFNPLGSSTGTATVAGVTESGTYLFVPAGLTPAATGPAIGGEVVRGIGFDGAAGYVARTGGIALSQDFTVSFWINPVSTAGTIAIVAQRAGANTGQFFIFLLASAINVDTPTGGATGRWNTSVGLTTGAWQHIAVTYNGTNRYLYVNGAATGPNGDRTGALNGTAADLFLGRDSSAAQYYLNGSMAATFIAPAALSAGEINMLYRTAKFGEF